MRGKGFKAGARREEGEYPNASSTDEQRRSRLEELPPFGLSNGGPLAALLLSHRALRLCSFVAWIRLRSPQALASGPPLLSAPLPIYEMGSNTDRTQKGVATERSPFPLSQGSATESSIGEDQGEVSCYKLFTSASKRL